MQVNEPFDISIHWSTPVDLDLCVFFRSRDGRVGGVFSDEFRSEPGDLGSLNNFPYILHMGDEKEPLPGKIGRELVKVGDPSIFDRLDVVVINYADAIDLLDVDYNDPNGGCTIGGQSIEAKPTGRGQAYHVATLSRGDDGALHVQPVNRILPLGEAYDSIPGFPLVCE